MNSDHQELVRPVILCGGSGSRLWPLSREMYPKQLLALTDKMSLLQQTVLRAGGDGFAQPILVTNDSHRFLVAEQMRSIGLAGTSIMLEPCGRNTAPAVAVAAFHATAHGENPILLVLPADHVIADVEEFREAVAQSVDLVKRHDVLVTFGIVPTAPETGYGYIRRGDALGDGYRVAQFVEKPDAETASSFIKTGQYFWNSGMFVFRAERFLSDLAEHAPEVFAACKASFADAMRDADFVRLQKSAFETSPNISIDYAVMEKTSRAVMVPLAAGWNDIGSFSALWECSQRDDLGNATFGDVIMENSRNCYVNSSSRMVAVVGADDLVIVETADAVLVVPRRASQNIKRVVERLRLEGREEYSTHRRVYRPWGCYEGVDKGGRYQVKRITVNPGASLSLQMHYHRAEHWIVVSGVAEVTCQDRVFLVAENESTFIPLGHRHRLRNPGKVPLEMIEVQSGSYLGEDDIVRIEDSYGRT